MKELYKALAAFQQEAPVIHKGTEGYGYSYATLATIFGVINPLLKKHGLGFYQAVSGKESQKHILNEGNLLIDYDMDLSQTIVETVVFHVETGQTVSSKTPVPTDVALGKMNPFQVMGSGITYIRRYALSSLLGLVTDKDTDAATPKGNDDPF